MDPILDEAETLRSLATANRNYAELFCKANKERYGYFMNEALLLELEATHIEIMAKKDAA
jgi:hypothetical protein